MNVLIQKWQLLTLIIAWLLLCIAIRMIGKKLERLQGTSFLKMWLIEIGSDLRMYGVTTTTIFFTSLAIQIYVKNKLLDNIANVLMQVSISIWVLLSLIAAIVQFEEYSKRLITASSMLAIDKRNYLTLTPIALSIFKLGVYILFLVYLMHVIKIDVTPILNIGGIMLAALTFSGADTIKSFLATIKIFLTRRYYVGSRVKINSFKIGTVTRITIVDTTITTDAGENQIIENSEIKTIVVYKNIDG